MARKTLFATLLLFPLILTPLAGASAGREGAEFLDIPVGATPASLGSAYTALASDAYAPVWNPAGLGFLRSPEAAGQHLSYLESIHYEFASVVAPIKAGHALGASIQYLGTGDINGTDTTGASIGTFTNHFAAYSLSYGQIVASNLSVGLTGKLIESKLADASAHAFAGDAGALYQAGSKLNLAATVTNIGGKLEFTTQKDSLPLAFHLGAAYRPLKSWAMAAEGLSDRHGKVDGRFGLEFRPVELVGIRAGYRSDTLKELSNLAGFSTGVGLHLWGQEFAYAWVPYGDLGDTQYFSLLLHFGGRDEERRNLNRL